ncbi:MAG: hypothetical protein KDK39_10480 [Leptospiraceae bacterium]|nr:hypothetical protein [Leptospiraceae bacterium]
MNRLKYFLFHSDSRWVVLLIAIALFFLMLFYVDYSREADIGTRKVIGKIVYKNNTVQRKFADEVVWSNLRSNSPLTNMDLIRSENLSDAIIYLNGDTKIKIDENSMFFLDLSGDQLKLEFSGGSIQIEQGSESLSGKMTIKSGDAVINVGDADLKIVSNEGQGNKGALNLYVQKGQASLNVDGQSQSIGKNQKAAIDGKEVAVKDVEVRLVSPAAQELVTTAQNEKMKFNFNTAAGYTDSRLEIARDRNFNRIVRTLSSSEARVGVALSPGTWYWRVKARDQKTGQIVTSELRRFRMVENKPVQTYSPDPNQPIRFVDNKPTVGFAWAPSPLANSYTLELAKDSSFKSGVRRFQTQSSSYSVSDLPPGDWYWRVRSKSEIAGVAEQVSPVKRVRIEKRDAYDAPVVERPVKQLTVDPAAFEKGVLFVWQSMAEINRFTFQVSKDPSFSKTQYQTVTEANFVQLRQQLAEGSWYWRVQGQAASGKTSRWSEAASFIVQDKSKTAKEKESEDDGSGQLVLLVPQGVVDMSGQNRLIFRWRPDARSKAWRISLFQVKDGRTRLVHRSQTTKPVYVLTDLSVLDVGPFIWQIDSLGQASAPQSARQGFRVTLKEAGSIRPDDIEFLSPEKMYR